MKTTPLMLIIAAFCETLEPEDAISQLTAASEVVLANLRRLEPVRVTFDVR